MRIGTARSEPWGSRIGRRAFVQRSAGAVASLGALGWLAEGCGDNGSPSSNGATNAKPPPKPTGKFVRPNTLEPDTFDPATSLAGGLIIVFQVYEGLVRFAPDGKRLEGVLATSWEESDDGREWTFELRPNVRFHDGEQLDAEAVKATFAYIERQKGFTASLLPKFREVDASDPRRVRLVLERPFGDMARNQAFLRIMSPKLARAGTKEAARTLAGTGAYRFASRAKGRSVTLEPFEGYWGGGPHFERLEFPLIQDLSARLNALATGQADQVVFVPPPQVQRFARNSKFREQTRDGWRVAYLNFVTTNDAVKDVRVRQAVAHAIDRKAIVDHVLLGRAYVADSVMPRDVYGHARPRITYAHNPERARQLLAAAGSGPGHKLRMAVSPAIYVEGEKVAQAIEAQLKEVGFDASLDIVENNIAVADRFSDSPKRDVYFDEHTWANGSSIIFSIELIQDLSKFNPPELRRLNAQQNVLSDGPERLRVLKRMQDLMAENVPYVPLHVPKLTDIERAEIHGYVPSKDSISGLYGSAFRAT